MKRGGPVTDQTDPWFSLCLVGKHVLNFQIQEVKTDIIITGTRKDKNEQREHMERRGVQESDDVI